MARFIVTEIVPFIEFHPAEEYHCDYYENNPHNSYCQFVVGPKIKKFAKECKECLNSNIKRRSKVVKEKFFNLIVIQLHS